MQEPSKRLQPGDLIIAHYLPDASPEVKEEARKNLMRLADAIDRLGK